ncbi:extracellular catalytic domain type 1 short-chain-length polyhydroxyalkanoate depolymerase [Candidatus Thiosymbion oneisti]|uniref:extracellular catalytic domain type 1 short-chain-length polyhydroxyalkanoate depolymerase n=1 Tax=Candidatus Thiosymbion oneisti TaxID=589554 RepID=UPI000A82A19D|nr:PHB depolymerase family esterase [Candidatus Thiosymbion oneisti]
MATGLKRYEFGERLADILGESRRDLRFRVTMLVADGLVAPGPRGRGSPPATPHYAAKLLLGSMAAPQQSYTVEAIRCYERLRPTARTADPAAPRITLGPRPLSRHASPPPTLPLLSGHRTFGEILARLLELATMPETRQGLARELFGIWVSRSYPVSAVQLGAWSEGQRNIITQGYEPAGGERPPVWLDPERDGNPDPGLYHTLFLPAAKLVEIGKLTSLPDQARPPMINLGPKMARISKLADLVRQTRFRGRWEQLLAALASVQAWSDQVDTRASKLVEVRDFGSNPGQLRMLTYVPDRLPAAAPLVVLLHGCTQSGVSFDKGTGWSTLADRHGFALLLPEQHWTNNPLRCFNWFRPADTRRDEGEALSIKQMIDRILEDHGLDRRQVYVTGLSSGGAMTSVMLATYPDLFAGGAVLAGVPYRTADNMQEAFESIFQGRSRTPREWGNLVRGASPHRGPWPKVSVWHGDADSAVKPLNADELVKQWTDVHGVAASPPVERTVDGHLCRVWQGADGEPLVESYTIGGMSHGAPLSTGDRPDQCGTAAPFFNDVGISSAFHIAGFWGLLERESDASVAAATATADRARPTVIDLSRDYLSRDSGGDRPDHGQPEGIYARGGHASDQTAGSAARRPESGGTDAGSESVARGVPPGILVEPSGPEREETGPEPSDRASGPTGGGDVPLGIPLGINVHGIVRKSLAAAGLIQDAAPAAGESRAGDMPFGIDIPGIIGTSLEAAGRLRGSATGPDSAGSTKEAAQATADSDWEGEGWELLTDDSGGPRLFGQVSSGRTCETGKQVRSASRKIVLGPSPELSYVRRLNLDAAVNDYTSASFSVLVDGTPVDEASAVGMEHVEVEWLQRSDIDLSRFAERTVTLTFEVAASSNVCSEVSAKAWVDRIRIKSVSSVC